MKVIVSVTVFYLLAGNMPGLPETVSRPRTVPVAFRKEACGNSEGILYPLIARECFRYLNEFRNNPVLYGQRIGLNLSGTASTRTLTWDPLLADAATEKAMEMATKNYFSHIDPAGKGMNYRVVKKGYLLPGTWIDNPAANYIESIAANSHDPLHFIDQLILDKGVQDKAHRQHLLGTTNFYRNASRIGIAIVYNKESVYKYYCCILIAPRFAAVAPEGIQQ